MATGLDPYTGEKTQFEGNLGDQLLARGLAAAGTLLSLPGPLRTGIGPLPEAGRLGKGPQSEASKKFDSYDPQKDTRSILNPFIGLSSQGMRKKSKLSQAFEQSSVGPRTEYAQVFEMIDKFGPERAMELLREQAKGKKAIKGVLGSPPEVDDPKIQRVFDLYWKLKAGKSAKAGPLASAISGDSAGPLASALSSSGGPLK